jgi:hypothetical protein
LRSRRRAAIAERQARQTARRIDNTAIALSERIVPKGRRGALLVRLSCRRARRTGEGGGITRLTCARSHRKSKRSSPLDGDSMDRHFRPSATAKRDASGTVDRSIREAQGRERERERERERGREESLEVVDVLASITLRLTSGRVCSRTERSGSPERISRAPPDPPALNLHFICLRSGCRLFWHAHAVGTQVGACTRGTHASRHAAPASDDNPLGRMRRAGGARYRRSALTKLTRAGTRCDTAAKPGPL